MALQKILVHRAEHSDFIDIETTSAVSAVRELLLKRGFLKEDSAEEAWRFFFYSSESSRFSDAIIAKDVERLIKIDQLFGPGGQLYLTNIEKGKRPDLMGLGGDWFFDRLVGCRVTSRKMGARARSSCHWVDGLVV